MRLRTLEFLNPMILLDYANLDTINFLHGTCCNHILTFIHIMTRGILNNIFIYLEKVKSIKFCTTERFDFVEYLKTIVKDDFL